VPDLKLKLASSDPTGRTVQADWTFNQKLDGVTQSFLRLDWGDGNVTNCPSGTSSATHAYTSQYERMVYVKLLGNDVNEQERINILPGLTPPFYDPDLGDLHTVNPQGDSYRRALADARKVMPAKSPWIGSDNSGALKPVR